MQQWALVSPHCFLKPLCLSRSHSLTDFNGLNEEKEHCYSIWLKQISIQNDNVAIHNAIVRIVSSFPFYFKSCFSGVFNLLAIFLPWISGLGNKVGQLVGQSVCLSVCLLSTHIIYIPAVHNADWQNHPFGVLFGISFYIAQNHCCSKKWGLANDLPTIQSN